MELSNTEYSSNNNSQVQQQRLKAAIMDRDAGLAWRTSVSLEAQLLAC
jgi:hypothetical protein